MEGLPGDPWPADDDRQPLNRWSWRGLWGRIFGELVTRAELPKDLGIDSTAVRAHRSAQGGKGGRKQAIGRLRGGPMTKIHDLTDDAGRIAAFSLTPGNVADISAGPGRTCSP